MSKTAPYLSREDIKFHMQGRVGQVPEAVLGIIGDLEVTEAGYDRLYAAIEHVVNDSPGTPDSVKSYLRGVLKLG